MLQNKDAYAENPEADYTNYYSILASGLSDKINYGFVSTFLNKKTNTYLLKPEDIFQGIDKLKIDENYAIICFGINIDYFREILGISNLSENKYKNIRLYLFDNLSIANSSIFILKETNLPNLSTTSINPQKIEKYSLEKLSDSLNLYASIIDLNDTTPELMNESKKDMTEEELRKSVLLSIIISVEITWKKNIEMIHIQQYSKYRQEGLPDKPNKIKPTK